MGDGTYPHNRKISQQQWDQLRTLLRATRATKRSAFTDHWPNGRAMWNALLRRVAGAESAADAADPLAALTALVADEHACSTIVELDGVKDLLRLVKFKEILKNCSAECVKKL